MSGSPTLTANQVNSPVDALEHTAATLAADVEHLRVVRQQ